MNLNEKQIQKKNKTYEIEVDQPGTSTQLLSNTSQQRNKHQLTIDITYNQTNNSLNDLKLYSLKEMIELSKKIFFRRKSS